MLCTTPCGAHMGYSDGTLWFSRATNRDGDDCKYTERVGHMLGFEV